MLYNPKVEISKLTGDNVLIINRSNDFQISEEEAQFLIKGTPKATLVIIEKMNHVLRIIEGDDGLENTKPYNQPITSEIVKEITRFNNE